MRILFLGAYLPVFPSPVERPESVMGIGARNAPAYVGIGSIGLWYDFPMDNHTHTWELPLATLEDTAFVEAIKETFTDIYREWFSQEIMVVNHDLPILVRALRRVECWRVFLLLTPWMLARIFAPSQAPPIPIPEAWRGPARADKPYTVIGPAIGMVVRETAEKAHINYHPRIGHYLVQPLIQSMESFTSPDEAFEAWNTVIRTRTENIRELNRRCRWQEDISRRELFHPTVRET
uniref:Uncharacterized protein n=1 Tax=Candidatus Kentrum eta TaxID=2126337 RepID=A0A450URF0_9GAMM|nr:MAG: Protein of unknown function (DUF3457) [Candidatus Kentron sp. H]VFJ88903.1 MAG: Protein of unknown function (DUF3457) [Candidatus Kentron sp. H]VFJ95144.1 MAG: Protein of unknown function (DUF3457) [Candidatus Kentron sp. H]